MTPFFLNHRVIKVIKVNYLFRKQYNIFFLFDLVSRVRRVNMVGKAVKVKKVLGWTTKDWVMPDLWAVPLLENISKDDQCDEGELSLFKIIQHFISFFDLVSRVRRVNKVGKSIKVNKVRGWTTKGREIPALWATRELSTYHIWRVGRRKGCLLIQGAT